MKVRIPDKRSTKTTMGEMAHVDEGEVGQIVGEMLTEPAKLKDHGFSQEVVDRAAAMKVATEDPNPEYAIVRVEEGWSGSRRLWPAKEIDRIVDQTNQLQPVGHLGHIKDEDAAFVFPDPQTTWLGAYSKDEPSKQKGRAGEMVRVAYFAGYNHVGAKIRQHIRTKSVRGVSWWGEAHQVPIPGKGVEMRNFDLKALDWARKLAEGMPSTSIVAIAGEMKEGSEKMDKELAAVTPEEFKTANPNGYALLRKEVEDESKATIGEMEDKIAEGDKAKSLLTKACELLGLDKPEDIEAKITEMKTKVGDRAKASVAAGIAAIVKEKVPGDDNDEDVKAKRALVMRLLPVGEMESEVSDSTDEDAKKTISEMVDKAFSTDDALKTIIGEQQPAVVRRREELRMTGSESAANDYISERSRVQVGG